MTGQWTATVKGQNWGPVDLKGYWSVGPFTDFDDCHLDRKSFQLSSNLDNVYWGLFCGFA
jgi:hypothetical protein